MEDIDDASDLSDLRVPKNAIIETVAEAVLNEKKPTAVVNENNEVIGVLRRRTILHILFGDSADSIISNQGVED